MLREKNALVGHLSVQLSGEVVSRLAAFVVTAAVSRTLGLSSIGVLTLAQSLAAYATVVGDAGLNNDGTRRLAKGESRSIIGQITGAQVVLTLVGMLPVCAMLYFMDFPAQVALTTLIILPASLALALNVGWVLQADRHVGALTITTVSGQLIATSLALVSLYFELSLFYVAAAMTTGVIATTLLTRRSISPEGRRPAFRGLKRQLVRGRSYVGLGLLSHLYGSAPLLFLGLVATSFELGKFAAALRLMFLLLIPGQLLSMNLLPRFAAQSNDSALLRTVSGGALAAGCICAVIVQVTSQPLLRLSFGAEGDTARACLIFFSLLVPLSYVNNVCSSWHLAHGQASLQLRALMIGFGVLVCSGVPAVIYFGAIGAIGSVILGELATVIVSIASLSAPRVELSRRLVLIAGYCTPALVASLLTVTGRGEGVGILILWCLAIGSIAAGEYRTRAIHSLGKLE
jgi:O-antigen/teichoic acid export membrane protein